MNEIERIVDQMKRAHDGEAWHGPSVREALVGVTAAQAQGRPIGHAHTIWEITRHLTSWDDAVRRSLQGEVFDNSTIDDWPKIGETNEAAWQAAVAQLEAGQRTLRDAVAAFDPAGLDTPRPGRSAPGSLMWGILQHALYHAGQISLLRKAGA
jgi:uncharacterized damage-inducible protein DinB